MPGDPRWTGPPETVAAIFEAGSAAAVVANNMVWVTETSHHEVAAGVSSANTAATMASWAGLGSAASTAAVNGLNVGLHTAAGWTAHKIGVTQGAVDAFTTARSSVIPSTVSQSNRARREAMDKVNPSVLWSFTPAIAQHDLEYFGEHWPHNSTIGMGYSTALGGFTAALGTPPPLAPEGASPAAPAAAGEALSQAASSTAAQDGISLSNQAAQAAGQAPVSATGGATEQISSFLGPLQEAASGAMQPAAQFLQAPTQGLQSFSSLPSTLMGAFGGMFSSASGPPAAEIASLAGPLGSGGVAAGGIGAGAAGAAGGLGAVSGAGLTSYTRPTSTFEPESGGRPMSLRTVAATPGPTTSMGGGLPMAPLAARGNSEESNQQAAVAHARIVVAGDPGRG
ncbi:PPE domain-containing protein [Mycobacterium sp.]|uniref:PPE domain-containing protein n=1 Tax=Mycobacterium sp. TaxID=1785 RepID=UPI0031D8B353